MASIKALSEYARDEWSTRAGLPHNHVADIAQTPDGYLWIATWEGLVRYNGVSFRIFDRTATPLLSDSVFRSLSITRDGGVLATTARSGVVHRSARGEWRSWTVRDGLSQNETWRAIEDRRGRIWVATENGRIDRIDGDTVHHFGKADGLLTEGRQTLTEDGDGTIWVGSSLGMARIVGDQVETHLDIGLPEVDIQQVAIGPDGSVWAATRAGGFVLRRGESRFVRMTPEGPDTIVTRVLPIADGSALFGTPNRGVLVVADRRVGTLEVHGRMASNQVSALFKDRDGSIWIGTSAGLLRLRDTPFSTLTTQDGLPDNSVRSVLADTDGTLWIGSITGLAAMPPGAALAPMPNAQGLTVLTLAPASAGGIWVGTIAEGLLRYHNGQITRRVGTAQGLVYNEIRAVVESRDGTVWAGTPIGLSRIRDGEIATFGTDSGLPHRLIRSLIQARDGRIWVATGGGLAISEGDGFRTLPWPSGVDARDVFALHEDDRGVIWAASDRGLLRVESDQIAAIGMDQGLPVDVLLSVSSDHLGNLWLSSNRGVIRVNRDVADAVAARQLPAIQVERFGEYDGLITASCSGGSSPAAATSADGRIWIATAEGLAFIQPAELPRFKHEAPPAIIDEVAVDGVALASTDALILTPGQVKLEIRFAVRNVRSPERIQYRHQLTGLDSDWIDSGNNDTVQYTNLSPGDYQFQLLARLPGGSWSAREAQLPFRVEPQLLQRRPVQVLLVLLVLIGIWQLVRARTRQLAEREARLQALVSQRTNDLREQIVVREAAERALLQRNTDLETANRHLAYAQNQLLQSEKMASVGQLAAGVAHEINNPIGFVRSNLTSLTGYFKEVFGLLAGYEKVGNTLDINSIQREDLSALTASIDLEYLREDIPSLLVESMDGIARVEKIVQDLVSFSSVSGSKWAIVDLHEGLEQTLSVAAHKLKPKVEVIKEYGKLPLVECNPFQINQVFLSLLINAEQAIDKHGTVRIRSGESADGIWLEFTDSGGGIPAEILPKIFDPFFTTKPVGSGTGLGLSVAYGIIQKHAGRIEVSSTVNVGTTFTLYLPVRSQRTE